MNTAHSVDKTRAISLLAVATLICASLLPGSTGLALAQPNPHIGVVVNEDSVTGYDWPLGALVTLTIDDPTTPQSPDYTDVQKSEPQQPGIIAARFDLSGKFDIQAGHMVILTDGIVTKSHVVTQVTVTTVDSITDAVSGTAEPGTPIAVVAEGSTEWALRVETADSVTGAWTADFSVPGDALDEQDTFDIRLDTGGKAVQGDEDGDDTNFTWQVRDSDGDGLADDADACPAQDSTGYDADANGCLDTPEGLIALIKSMPEDAVAGKVKKSLIKDVGDAIRSLEKGKDQTAIGQLDKFIEAIENQRGKRISNEAADLLIAYARNVIRQIENGRHLNLGAMFESRGGGAEAISPAADNAVTLAVEQANAAGGILGSDVIVHHRSAGDNSELVRQAAVDLIENRHVQAIVGPIVSASTLAILQDTIVPARVLLVSPSNTNPRLAELPDEGLYFRTSSSDAWRGRSAGLRACELGYTTAATIHRAGEPYGENLVIAFADGFSATCGGSTRAVELVDNVGAAVREAVADSPEVVFVALAPPDERVAVVQHAFCEQDANGRLAADRYWSFGDQLRSNFVSDVLGGTPCDPGEAPEEVLAGYETMAPALEVDLGNADFQAAYTARFGEPPTVFANAAYDAAVLVMLAAEETRSLDPLAIRDHMVSVSTGGVPVSDFAEALSLMRAGVDVDWVGTYEGMAAGFTYDINHDFEPDGETILPYLISQIQFDGTMPIVAAVSADDLRGSSGP